MRRGREFAHTPADMGIWYKTFGVNPRPTQPKTVDVGTSFKKRGESHIEQQIGGVQHGVLPFVESGHVL